MERAPRYSTRVVTKRPFKRLGTIDASNKEENVEPAGKDKDLSEKPQLNSRKKNDKSINNSPIKQTPRTDHNDNENGNDENAENESIMHTPVKLQRLNDDDIGLPGDVSVTFLASTPKPGRPQLSRRRPLSSVSESASITVPQNTSKSIDNSTKTNSTSIKKVKVSVPKDSFRSVREDVNAGRSLNDKIKKISQSTLEKKRHERRASTDKTRSFSSSLGTVSKNSEAVHSSSRSSQSGSHRKDASKGTSQPTTNTKEKNSKSSKKVQSKSVVNDKTLSRTKDVSGDKRTRGLSTNMKVTNSDKSSISARKTIKDANSDKNKKKENDMSALRKSSRVLQSSAKRKTDSISPDSTRSKVAKQSQRKENVSSSSNNSEHYTKMTSVNGKVSSSKSVSKRNITAQKTQKNKFTDSRSSSSDNESRSSSRRKESTSSSMSPPAMPANYSSKKNNSNQRDRSSDDTTERQNDTTENTMKDQTVMLWQTDETKRTKRDVMDLDIVLSTVVENLSSSHDVYDLPDEQLAIKRLKKYLVTDIKKMIQSAQSVTNLQSRIKLSKQSIKQKQKKLMSLQKEKTELDEKCLPTKELRERNKKMTEINDFVSSLKSIVNQC